PRVAAAIRRPDGDPGAAQADQDLPALRQAGDVRRDARLRRLAQAPLRLLPESHSDRSGAAHPERHLTADQGIARPAAMPVSTQPNPISTGRDNAAPPTMRAIAALNTRLAASASATAIASSSPPSRCVPNSLSADSEIASMSVKPSTG